MGIGLAWDFMKLKFRLLITICFMIGCASTQREVEILGFQRLVITDIGSDNIMPTNGTSIAGAMRAPLRGVPLNGAGEFDQGGILSASRVRIVGATGSTIVIQRAITGNHNLEIDSALSRVLLPSANPFGNILMDGDEYLREQ